MTYMDFACPKFALKWLFIVAKSILIMLITLLLIDDKIVRMIGITIGIFDYMINCWISSYGLSLNKVYIPTKVSTEGISNPFCKIKWDEVEQVCFEHLEIKRWFLIPSKHIRGDFGLVALIHKKKDLSERNFKKSSLIKTVCISWDVKTRAAIMRNCPEVTLMRKIAGEAGDITILDALSERKTKYGKRNTVGLIVSYKDLGN